MFFSLLFSANTLSGLLEAECCWAWSLVLGRWSVTQSWHHIRNKVNKDGLCISPVLSSDSSHYIYICVLITIWQHLSCVHLKSWDFLLLSSIRFPTSSVGRNARLMQKFPTAKHIPRCLRIPHFAHILHYWSSTRYVWYVEFECFHVLCKHLCSRLALSLLELGIFCVILINCMENSALYVDTQRLLPY